MIDYYQLLMQAQQGAPQGARWHHDPSMTEQWRYSQPTEYVSAPDQQTPQYQPITPPRRADLYEPMASPTSMYDTSASAPTMPGPSQQPQAAAPQVGDWLYNQVSRPSIGLVGGGFYRNDIAPPTIAGGNSPFDFPSYERGSTPSMR